MLDPVERSVVVDGTNWYVSVSLTMRSGRYCLLPQMQSILVSKDDASNDWLGSTKARIKDAINNGVETPFFFDENQYGVSAA